MNISLILTLVRLVLSPLLLAPLVALGAPAYLTFFCYCLLALTDFFDGFFARRYHQVSQLGAFLDQFSDKIFLFSVMFALVATGQCLWWWALALSIRELFVMGLREYSSSCAIELPVIYTAKIKTAFQIIFFGWLLMNAHVSGAGYVTWILLGVTLFFSYYSAYFYFKKIKEKLF